MPNHYCFLRACARRTARLCKFRLAFPELGTQLRKGLGVLPTTSIANLVILRTADWLCACVRWLLGVPCAALLFLLRMLRALGQVPHLPLPPSPRNQHADLRGRAAERFELLLSLSADAALALLCLFCGMLRQLRQLRLLLCTEPRQLRLLLCTELRLLRQFHLVRQGLLRNAVRSNVSFGDKAIEFVCVSLIAMSRSEVQLSKAVSRSKLNPLIAVSRSQISYLIAVSRLSYYGY